MKKTMRKAIASILAVLMVICAMPFTAFAAQLTDEYIDSYNDFTGYADQGADYFFGDGITLVESKSDPDAYVYLENSLHNSYKPVFHVIVSDFTTTAQAAPNYNYYGKSKDVTYNDLDAEGKILDPTNLKKDQVVAVTIELSGLDTFFVAQVAANYDPNLLQAGNYGRRAWEVATGNTSAVLTTGATLMRDAYNTACATDGGAYVIPTSNRVSSTLIATNNPSSTYVTSNAAKETGYGTFGLTFMTFALKVLEDCDLTKALVFDASEGIGCFVQPYHDDDYENVDTANWDLRRMELYNGQASVVFENVPSEEPADHVHDYTETTIPATCTDDAKIVKTCSNADGKCDAVTVEEIQEGTALGHDFAGALTSLGNGNHTVQCTRCDATETAACTFTATPSGATCTEGGSIVYTCDCGYSYTESNGAALGHDMQVASEEITTPATCETDGVKTITYKCSRCDETETKTETIEALGHDLTSNTVTTPATCEADGSEVTTTTCSRCDYNDVQTKVLEALGHDLTTNTVTVEATYDADGSVTTTTTCSRCDYLDEDVQVLPMLEGIKVTVIPSALGTATVKGLDVVDEAVEANCAPNSDVVLTATPVDGAVFAGWNVDGKLVATDATITVKALADITYVPVFQVASTDKFTVVFADRYGNFFATQEVTSGAEVDFDAVKAPTVAGYTFVGWSLTAEEITGPTIVQAVYEKNADAGYTVTADGCTITFGDVTAADVLEGVAYDSLVTVTADGAKAWTINGATVAYGESYTFYVGSDVTVVPVFDAVTATPTVAAVSVTEINDGAKVKASFLASRSMTDDCKYVSAGFVYGKNLADDNITLDDVKAGSAVKAYYCATDAEQFALTYSLAAQQGKMTARAFLAYVNAQGETVVIYAEPQTYTYA